MLILALFHNRIPTFVDDVKYVVKNYNNSSVENYLRSEAANFVSLIAYF